MPKRADAADAIDPVRSRLAQAAASSVAPIARPMAVPTAPAAVIEPVTVRAVGEGNIASARRAERPAGVSISLVNRKIVVTAEEAERMEQSADLIAAAFGGRVNYSQISRAMWSVLAGAEDAMLANVRRATKRKAPSKGNPTGMAEYEKDLADFLTAILKKP